MMPPQPYAYQPGMEYNMAPGCQPPPPYPGSPYVSYDMCQQAHSSLNPYAEPFMGVPQNQPFYYHPDEHRCIATAHGQNKILTDLHQKRNEILSRLQKCNKKVKTEAQTAESWSSDKSRTTGSSQEQSGSDSAGKLANLSSKETASGWDSDYQNWSTGDGSSCVWTKNAETRVKSPDLMVDGPDVWNESGSDTTDFMLNWLKDIPDNPAPVEPDHELAAHVELKKPKKSTKKQGSDKGSGYYPAVTSYQNITGEKENYYKSGDAETDYRRLSIASDNDDSIIPFDTQPTVSKFGPISRVVKPKSPSSSNAVQVTAEEKMVTTVTSSLKSKPQVFPTSRVASRKVNQPISAVLDSENLSACAGYSRLLNYPPNVKSCVKKEIARLEEKALLADTEDEWLACELQAVELQISLQTAKPPLITSTAPSDLPREELIGTKLWAKYSGYERPDAAYREWTDLDKALQAQEIETKCLKYRNKQEKQDRLLAQKLVLEELNAAGPPI